VAEIQTEEEICNAVMNRGFEQHYLYENMVMELLEAIKQTSIDKYFK